MRASFHRGTLRYHHTGNSKANEYQDGMLNGLCMHHAWTMGGIKPETVTHCLGVRLGLGFGFGVGVPESGMGWDGASASGSLRRLVFRIRYLVIGGGHLVGHDGEAVDSEEGDRHEWRANAEDSKQQ